MNHKNTHVLLLTSEFPPQPGGIGQHSLDLAKHLTNQHQVTVIADQRSKDNLEEQEFDSCLNFQVLRVKRHAIILHTYMLRLWKTLSTLSKFDIVLASGKFSLWQVHLIKLFYPSKPVIAIIHGSEVLLPSKYAKNLTDAALRKSNHVIAVSNYTLSLVKHLNLKSTQVIPNGIADIPEINAASLVDQQINLLTVGNLTQRKGQHNVIEALPVLLNEFPQIHYHCVGLPTNLSQLQQLAQNLNVDHVITFHGRVSDTDKQLMYTQSHIFLMLSERTITGDVEGFGIAILEANSYGIPAIGSKGSGIEDAINSGLSGYLVDPHKQEDVLNAVRHIINDYANFNTQAKTWSEGFKWDELILDYHEQISKLCK